MSFSSQALTTLTLLTLAQSAPAFGAGAPLTEVRVRLRHVAHAINVTGYGLRISPPSRLTAVALPLVTRSVARVRTPKRGRWIVDWDNQPSREYSGDRLWVKGQVLHLGTEPAPFDLEFVAVPTGGIDVVAHLDLESYLLGVLPAEMPIAWPLQALKAQAVAARSFAVTLVRERRARHYDVDSTVIDQVYKYAADSDRRPAWFTKLRRAVNETEGQVLTDSRGRVLKAFYSADCGCTTEDPLYVWGRLDGFESVTDPTCAIRRPLRWSRGVGRSEAARRLARGLKLDRARRLDDLQIGERTPSGRVANVIATVSPAGSTSLRTSAGASPKKVILNVNEFRRIFGYRRIRSADFDLKWTGDVLNIAGVGVGHGVGMCQTGARAMADGGSTYRAILKQYYPRAEINAAPAI